jgi:(2R)-3-sulfolactate dehydrogenase (NADP+)
MRLSIEEVRSLCATAFKAHGVAPHQAGPTVDALLLAESQGLASHGLSRVPMYLAHVRHRRVDATAVPKIKKRSPSAVLVDAGNGFAFPACTAAVSSAIEQARRTGIAIAAVTNSHHFGVAGNHLLKIAEAGMVGWAMGNSPAAMPAWGGTRAIFGTNPIAAIFPCRQTDPLLIDLSLSEVARGKIMVAAKAGKPIPEGWALDATGHPTTDAKAALTGMMLPMGGVKGAMLALMVELMVTTLTGAHFGAEADSFFIDEGNPPQLGQVFLAIDPEALAGAETYHARFADLTAVMLSDSEVRLPGLRRFDLARQAARDGLECPEDWVAQVRALGNRSDPPS